MLPQKTFIVVKIPIWIYVKITDVYVDIFVLKRYALEYPETQVCKPKPNSQW